MKKIILVIISIMFLMVMPNTGFVADKPVSQLPAAETITEDDLLMISAHQEDEQRYISKKITFAKIKTALGVPDIPEGMTYPPVGIPVSTGSAWGDAATYSTITGLWGSGSCSGYLKSDGTCDTPSGGGGFDVTGSYTPTGVWNWSTVGAGTTWPTFNQNTTGSAATATTATTATNLSSYAVLYDGAVTDGHIVKYDDTSKKLKDAGAAVGYTEPQSNLPLCRTGSGAVGACTNLTDVVVPQGGGSGYTNLTSFVAQTPWRLFYSNTNGAVTELALGADGQYLKSNGASAAPTWDTPSGGGSDIDYDPPQSPTPLCSDASGAIVACTNLKDEDLAEIEGSADDIGVKVETISEDPEAVIECEGKDRTYIVGFGEPSFFQLPADPSGIRYCFGNNDYGAAISIVPDGTDTITHAGTATEEGEGLVSTGSEADWVCLLGLSSSKWRTISYLGTWTIDEVELPSEPEEPPPGGDGAIGPSTWAQDSGTVTTTYGYSPLTPSQAGNVSYCHARLISGNGLTFPVGIYDASLTRLAYGAITPNSNDEGWYSTQLNTSVTLQDATTYNIALAASASWTASLRTFIVSGGPLYTAAETYSGETPPATLTYASDLSGNNIIFVVHCNNSATPPEEE